MTTRKYNRIMRKAKIIALGTLIVYALTLTARMYFEVKITPVAEAQEPQKVIMTVPEVKTPVIATSSPTEANTGKYAILDKIKQCESGGDYDAMSNVSSAYGAYQFTWATWNEVCKLTGRCDKRDHEAQEINARKLFDLYGTSRWSASKSCWNK